MVGLIFVPCKGVVGVQGIGEQGHCGTARQVCAVAGQGNADEQDASGWVDFSALQRG